MCCGCTSKQQFALRCTRKQRHTFCTHSLGCVLFISPLHRPSSLPCFVVHHFHTIRTQTFFRAIHIKKNTSMKERLAGKVDRRKKVMLPPDRHHSIGHLLTFASLIPHNVHGNIHFCRGDVVAIHPSISAAANQPRSPRHHSFIHQRTALAQHKHIHHSTPFRQHPSMDLLLGCIGPPPPPPPPPFFLHGIPLPSLVHPSWA